VAVRIRLAAFVAGFATLGLEVTAARLFAPSFGASLLVWSKVIVILLAALAAGYLLVAPAGLLPGKVPPRLPKLATRDPGEPGRASGSFFWISTAGSIPPSPCGEAPLTGPRISEGALRHELSDQADL